MKEQSSYESLTGHQQSSQDKKNKLERKRKIRKEKVSTTVLDLSDLRSIDTKKLNRQDKAKVQKAKNREAAQRSRDQHRQYVKSLEEQVTNLRELSQSSRMLCSRCQKQLEDSSTHDSLYSERVQQVRPALEPEFIEEDSQLELPIINSHNSMFDDEDSLMRVEENSQSYPFFKIGLLVVALVCVIGVNMAYNHGQSSRALMALPTTEEGSSQGLSIETLRKMQEKNKEQDDKNRTAVVKVENGDEHGLIALNSDCIKSLMKVDQPPAPIQKSLTSYNDRTIGQSALSPQEGILLCSLRMPKPFNPVLSQFRTPLVRLYLLGSEIKDLISNFNLMIPLRQSDNIQTNGIYQVVARIKQVTKVTNHNCLS